MVLDETLQVIRPAKLWNDTETARQNAALVERFGGKQATMERFGILPLTEYIVSKLLWLKNCEPKNFDRIRHILLPHDYLNFWLRETSVRSTAMRLGRDFSIFGRASGLRRFWMRLTEALAGWLPVFLICSRHQNRSPGMYGQK